MKAERKKGCDDSESLLVKKLARELRSDERLVLDRHLAQCAICVVRERELAIEWESFDALPVPEVPAALYESTRKLILSHLMQEKSPSPSAGRILRERVWWLFGPLGAGAAMTGVSYALIRNLVDLRIHEHHILITLFSLWGLLFAGCSWFVLYGKTEKTLLTNVLASFSISITFLALLLSYLASGVDGLRWLAMSAAYEIAVRTNDLFGIGNTFVAGWGLYACLASFLVSFVFGVRRAPAFSQSAFLGSALITLLLSPAIYLHGSSHDHGYGILAFGALGTFVGAFAGVAIGYMGSFVLRRVFAAAT